MPPRNPVRPPTSVIFRDHSSSPPPNRQCRSRPTLCAGCYAPGGRGHAITNWQCISQWYMAVVCQLEPVNVNLSSSSSSSSSNLAVRRKSCSATSRAHLSSAQQVPDLSPNSSTHRCARTSFSRLPTSSTENTSDHTTGTTCETDTTRVRFNTRSQFNMTMIKLWNDAHNLCRSTVISLASVYMGWQWSRSVYYSYRRHVGRIRCCNNVTSQSFMCLHTVVCELYNNRDTRSA